MLAPLLGGSTYTFGLILAVALAGIGAGSAVYWLTGRGRAPTLSGFAATCALEALCLIVPYALGDRLALLAVLLRHRGLRLRRLRRGVVAGRGPRRLPRGLRRGTAVPVIDRTAGAGTGARRLGRRDRVRLEHDRAASRGRLPEGSVCCLFSRRQGPGSSLRYSSARSAPRSPPLPLPAGAPGVRRGSRRDLVPIGAAAACLLLSARSRPHGRVASQPDRRRPRGPAESPRPIRCAIGCAAAGASWPGRRTEWNRAWRSSRRATATPS